MAYRIDALISHHRSIEPTIQHMKRDGRLDRNAYAYYHGHLMQCFIEHLYSKSTEGTFKDARKK